MGWVQVCVQEVQVQSRVCVCVCKAARRAEPTMFTLSVPPVNHVGISREPVAYLRSSLMTGVLNLH